MSCEEVWHCSPVIHLLVDEGDIHFHFALIRAPLLILHAVRWEFKLEFGPGILDNAAKARIHEEGLTPIKLWNEVNRVQLCDILCDFDILFVRRIVRVIDVDVIVTFRQIDGEVATEQEPSATNAFDEDGYTLDTFVLRVENLPLD